MSVYIDELGPEAPSVIAELTTLERLSLAGHSDPEDGLSLRLNDHALFVIADLPDLGSLSLLGGSYTEHGLQKLRRLPDTDDLVRDSFCTNASVDQSSYPTSATF
jgi:hypothetical protein